MTVVLFRAGVIALLFAFFSNLPYFLQKSIKDRPSRPASLKYYQLHTTSRTALFSLILSFCTSYLLQNLNCFLPSPAISLKEAQCLMLTANYQNPGSVKDMTIFSM